MNVLEQLEGVNIGAFIRKYKIKTESGVDLDFHDYRYLLDIYADNSPLLCCMKCAQIGFTTYEILKSLHEAKNENIDIIYVLPTSDDVKKFSGGKTNRIIANNPVLQEWTQDKDSVEQKQIGKATIYYLGSWTERVALMISASKLIVDEYDRCKPEVVEQYDSRLQFVQNPRKAFFSNPSLPDFGIDKIFQKSDKKKWHITHACGETFVMDEKCIDYKAEVYRCPKCLGEIADEERRMGKWIKTAEGKWSGYWIPLWINPRVSAKQIGEYKREKTPEYFANFVAGTPFLGGGDKVKASTITNCLSDVTNSHGETIIIGVDSGLPFYVVMANAEGYFYYGALSEPERELRDFLSRWPKSIIVSDQGGDLVLIRKLQAEFPGRVFLVWYRRDSKGVEIIKWGKDEEYGKVVADRNRLIQLFIDEMLDKRVTFNGTESEWQEYISHWMNIYRIWEENALGIKEFKWERNGPDHYVHATAYARIGLSRFSRTMAKIIGNDVWAGVPRGRIVESPVGQSPVGVILGDPAELWNRAESTKETGWDSGEWNKDKGNHHLLLRREFWKATVLFARCYWKKNLMSITEAVLIGIVSTQMYNLFANYFIIKSNGWTHGFYG